jgi:1-deoxy-D-xylulose-5-phosphate synthase
VTLGPAAQAALEAAEQLEEEGLSVAVLDARFAKPLDSARLLLLARLCGVVVTVEEASGQGGFGSAVLEALAEAGLSLPVRVLAIPDRLVEHGSPDAQRHELGIDATHIAGAVRDLVDRHSR